MNTFISILAAVVVLVPSFYAIGQDIFPAALVSRGAQSSGVVGPVGTNYWPLVWTNGTVNSGSFSLGNQFIVGGTNITVSGLCREATPGNTQSHSVGLYSLAGTLLSSNTIVCTNNTVNALQAVAVTPVVLLAHTTNMVVTQENTDGFVNNWTVATNGCATLVGDYYISSSTLSYPTSLNAVGGYPAGFIYQ